MSLLTLLTLVVAVAVVVVLATYLVLIAVALCGARRDLEQLAAGLDAIAADTAPLDERLGNAADAFEALGDSLAGVDAALGDVTEALGLEPDEKARKAG